MDQFYEFVLENCHTDPDKDLQMCDIKNVLKMMKPDLMGAGFNTRVFLTKDKKWVIKEGRWDIDLDLFSYGGFKFPKLLAKQMLEIFNRDFAPKPEVILSQYRDYLIFYDHLSYTNGSDRSNIDHHNRPPNQRQSEIRDDLEEYLKTTIKKHHLKINDHLLDRILELRYENLLPNEYLLYGEPISRENEFQPTYYIIQNYVSGITFHDSQINRLNERIIYKLLLIACLILIMYDRTSRIPDMRPRYIINEPIDWFTRTDNIIINHENVYFVDTRLLWNSKRGPIKRGLIIPEMTIRSCRAFINKTARSLG